MQKRFNVLKSKLGKAAIYGQAALLGCANTLTANAGGFTSVQINQNGLSQNPFTLMGSAIGVVLTIIQFIGIAAVIFGVVNVAQSVQEDNPDKKVKGFATLGTGVILFGLKYVLQFMGIVN